VKNLLKKLPVRRSIILGLFALLLVTGAMIRLFTWDHQRSRDELADAHRAADYVDWGLSACDRGDYKTALDFFGRAGGFDPDHPYLNDAFGRAYMGEGDWDRALESYTLALHEYASDAFACDGLARISAIAPDPRLRNGARAVTYAEKARDLSYGNVSDVLDTLAAAYAEAGRFDDAVVAENNYLQSAGLSVAERAAAEGRRALYRQHRSFHHL
jgi:tetratricopeptide (TPR) repeat protein